MADKFCPKCNANLSFSNECLNCGHLNEPMNMVKYPDGYVPAITTTLIDIEKAISLKSN